MSEQTGVVRADDPVDMSLSEAELEAHREHITEFIRDQLDAAGVDRAVIALSGGIDSTLTSHLLVEAVGAGNVHGLVMPSEVNREANMSDAERVASELLGVEYDVVAIEPIVEAFLDAYPDAADDRIAAGNLRVRTRAVLNYLVANLYKGQVRQLARHVGVPEDLAAKTASAEMWVGQTDEAELGLDYDTLDSILALHVDGPLSVSATADHVGVPESVVERVGELHAASAHKRRAPPGPEPL